MKVFSTRTEKIIFGTLSAAIFLLIWKLASLRIGTDIILPPPETVFLRLAVVMRSADFWLSVASTVLRTLYSLLISFILGFAAGIACGTNCRADAVLSPLVSFVRTTPVMSVILLAMIWFKTDYVPVFVGILMIFPILTANIREGAAGVDRKLLEMAGVYGLSRTAVLREITVPSIIPFVLAGLRSGIGVGWKAVIAAEVLSQPIKALGTRMQFSQMNLETADVIAWTLVAVVLSRISESVLDFIIRKKRPEAEGNV